MHQKALLSLFLTGGWLGLEDDYVSNITFNKVNNTFYGKMKSIDIILIL